MTILKVLVASVVVIVLLVSIFETFCAWEDGEAERSATYYLLACACGLTLATLVVIP